jgi:hypothetical protein
LILNSGSRGEFVKIGFWREPRNLGSQVNGTLVWVKLNGFAGVPTLNVVGWGGQSREIGTECRFPVFSVVLYQYAKMFQRHFIPEETVVAVGQ